jgi:hypothetical protein
MDVQDIKTLELTGNSRISYMAGAWYVPSQSSAARPPTSPSSRAPPTRTVRRLLISRETVTRCKFSRDLRSVVVLT